MAAVIAVGTDLVRIARLDSSERFLRRILTPAELELCGGRTESIAGRWAAKEATLKALGIGIGDVPLTDIEIGAEDRRPVLQLRGAAAQRAAEAGWVHWQVSISHEGEYAMAVVVATD